MNLLWWVIKVVTQCACEKNKTNDRWAVFFILLPSVRANYTKSQSKLIR